MLEPPVIEYRTPRTVSAGRDTVTVGGLPARRLIGVPELDMADPFLRFEAFSVPDRDGRPTRSPPYPQRGLDSVTYLLAGRIRYGDGAGRSDTVRAGGVQWLQTGRGIVRSDAPEGGSDPVRGLQFWVNVPGSRKQDPARCRVFGPDEVPVEQRGSQVRVRVIAGTSGRGTTGPVRRPLTDLRCLDVRLGAGAAVVEPIPGDHSALIYMMDGTLEFPGDDLGVHPLAKATVTLLSHGTELRVSAGSGGARFLLVAGRPLREPVARSGGLVMNTLAEVRAAERDFRLGRPAG